MTDGLSGIEESIHSLYPNAQFQQCCVHLSRNIAHKVRVLDRKEICKDFKLVYQANSKEEALDHIDFIIREFNQYNQKFLGRIHKRFKEVQDTLESMI